MREEGRRQRKLETAFRSLLKEMDVDYKSEWDDVRGNIENHQAFQAITLESERLRIFKVMFVYFSKINLLFYFKSILYLKHINLYLYT